MTFGFESEHFLRRDGLIVMPVPVRFPRDGAQNLVEVRSDYNRDVLTVLESYREKREALERLVGRDGYKLVTWRNYAGETAGFHIHFGGVVPDAVSEFVPILDRAFQRIVLEAGRVPGRYRFKPYGFEYRSLPATVSPELVVSVLERYFVRSSR